MADPAGEADSGVLRLDFDRRLMLRFRGSVITSDGGLLAYREMDDVLALTTTGGQRLADARTDQNRQHFLIVLLRQRVWQGDPPELFSKNTSVSTGVIKDEGTGILYLQELHCKIP